ncbi:RNA polymerase, sigma subunit, RpsG/SigG [Bittarella massiliensis (ex Durand et al. 2017)]|uniref:RNA polymerase sigma factor n=1 Tax=Bittarella massiliensis (ex Durand et al. 2017) TaxID=1720313 RepID=A0AAQ1MAZ4_9FIRM|nr:RNA polymerase sigma-G factor [Clostridium sp. ATCC 29733]SHF66619.1 RNA polymerase, sigma subunit, RpsG/SigG [Bittarella massiliensis (ex Durand et al. 2017)]
MGILYSGKVEICGVNTAQLKVLKEAENQELIRRYRESGSRSAREQLISGNLRLVLSVIKRFSSRGENLDDLFQVGCIGLIKAIDNFDTSHQVRFSTYAVPMIIGEIRRYLRDNNPIRVSRSLRDVAYKAMKAKEAFIAEHRREPTTTELAAALGMEVSDVVIALEAIVDPVSLYEPMYQDGGDMLFVIDQVGDYSDATDWQSEISMRSAIQALSEREKKIISLRFLGGKTQMEVAEEIGISQAQISRLEKAALEKIKKEL